jgi:hypothetical protein
LLFESFVLAGSALAQVNTVYISQNGGTFSGGSTCNGQTTISLSSFNSGKQSAGNVYVLCGTITSALSITGSGTSGNVLEVLWDTGARVSLTTGNAITMGANSYVLFDGGIPCGPGTNCATVESSNLTGYATGQTGIIEATNNGTGMSAVESDSFYGCNNCHDIEIRNLIMRNGYVHTSTSDTSAVYGMVFQCAGGNNGCASGTISIHDSVIHDQYDSISIEKTSGTTIQLYNLDMYRNNWEIENSGDGTRTVYVHDNHFHDASNWDTTNDSYHHDGFFSYMNVATDSLGIYFYNNLSDGNWGTCCATATMIYTSTDSPDNYYVFNNVAIQTCAVAETAPAFEIAATGGGFFNNTMIGCATTASNSKAVAFSSVSGGYSVENNFIEGYGQYIVAGGGSGTTFSTFDYNIYGPRGEAGCNAWSWNNTCTGESTFSDWQSACSCDSHGLYTASPAVSSYGQQQAGSPLAGAGANLTSIGITALDSATSLGGTITPIARPSSGAWDVGAYDVGMPQPPTGLVAVPH